MALLSPRPRLFGCALFSALFLGGCHSNTFDGISVGGEDPLTPTLKVSPTAIDFLQPRDGDCPRDLLNVNIANTGSEDLPFVVTLGGSNVSASPMSGVARAGDTATVHLTYTCARPPAAGSKMIEMLKFSFTGVAEPAEVFVRGEFGTD